MCNATRTLHASTAWQVARVTQVYLAVGLQVTGQKNEQKLYRKHSGYVGNLKETVFKDLMQKKPTEVRLASLALSLSRSLFLVAALGHCLPTF
eukprot:COSAG02_NODE_52757_length_306_cov_0.492754_1_plen_92_part_10